jgi:hypothetical protein
MSNNKCNKLSIYLLLLLISSLTFAFKARAGLLGDYDYNVSEDAKPVEQHRTIGSGSRSTCQNNFPKNSISLLVPEAEVVHQTSMSRPTFFLSSQVASTTPLKFTLVNPLLAKPIVESTFFVERQGIKAISLPPGIKLNDGVVYLWYVAIPCETGGSTVASASSEILSAAVERVPLSSSVIARLSKASNLKEIAAIYAHNGLWYDALSFAERSRSNYLQQLLSSVGLSNRNIALDK